MARSTVVSLKDCPFCGAKEQDLYIGAYSSLEYCVRCNCGALIIEKMPSFYTRREKNEIKEFEKIHDLTSIQAMGIFHKLNVVEKWNRRK